MPYDKGQSYARELVPRSGGRRGYPEQRHKPTTTISGSVEGEYTVRFTVSDGE